MNRRLMLKQVGALAALSAVAPTVLAQQSQFVTLPSKLEGDSPDKIEVIEFFHYGCPHCKDFDPLLNTWLKSVPEDVAFRRVPAIWGNAQLRELARLYYTIETTDHIETLHEAVFPAVQTQRRPLHTEEGVRAWVAGFSGVDASAFMDTYKSFGLKAMLQRADQLARAYRVQGVPTMAVGGRYVTSASMTGSHVNALKMVDELIVKARSERTG